MKNVVERRRYNIYPYMDRMRGYDKHRNFDKYSDIHKLAVTITYHFAL